MRSGNPTCIWFNSAMTSNQFTGTEVSMLRVVAVNLEAALLINVLLVAPCLSGNAAVTNASIPRMPPPGISLSAENEAELKQVQAGLQREIQELKEALKKQDRLLELLPDVEIYANAVRYALEDN